MSARVRKLSPEEVAAQGLVNLLHIEKAKLGVTDKDLRAWRPTPVAEADGAQPSAPLSWDERVQEIEDLALNLQHVESDPDARRILAEIEAHCREGMAEIDRAAGREAARR